MRRTEPTAPNSSPSPATPRSGRRRRWPRRAGAVAASALLLPAIAVTGAPEIAAAMPAREVPDVAALAGDLADQQLRWKTCDFGNPEYNDAFNGPGVECATVAVPRDWHHPGNGRTWKIEISRAENIEVDDPRYQGTIFANPGGPGGSGLVWGPALEQMTPDLNPYYNYVGFDPRGVGQSSHAECSYSWDPASKDPFAEIKAAGAACSTDADVQTINTEQTAYDMDFIRHLLGAPKLSYVGYSYGTWLGAWYEKVFGAKYGGRFLLDSAIDVTEPTLEETWNLQPIARDRQFERRIISWIARHDETYGLGEDPYLIHQRYFDATANLDPQAVMLFWLTSGAYSAFSLNSLYPRAGDAVLTLIKEGEAAEKKPDGRQPANPAVVAEELLTAFHRHRDGRQPMRSRSNRDPIAALQSIPTKDQQARQRVRQTTANQAPNAEKTATLDSPFDFVLCNDGQWTQGSDYWEQHNAEQAERAPFSEQLGVLTMPVCAFWRTGNLMPVADKKTFPDTIVVQDEMDSQTGWEGGRRAGTKLPNTSFIAIDDEGSHGLFPYGTEEVDRPIYDFFLDGTQPPNITVTQGVPLPADKISYESWRQLNKKAEHVGPGATSPWVPAGDSATPVSASDAGRSLLAEADSDRLLRQQVRRIYGPRGVDALESTGVL